MIKFKNQGAPSESPDGKEARNDQLQYLLRNSKTPEDVKRLGLLVALRQVERKLEELSIGGTTKRLLWNPVTRTALGVGAGLAAGYFSGAGFDSTGKWMQDSGPGFALETAKYLGAGLVGGLIANKVGGGKKGDLRFYKRRKRELMDQLNRMDTAGSTAIHDRNQEQPRQRSARNVPLENDNALNQISFTLNTAIKKRLFTVKKIGDSIGIVTSQGTFVIMGKQPKTKDLVKEIKEGGFVDDHLTLITGKGRYDLRRLDPSAQAA